MIANNAPEIDSLYQTTFAHLDAKETPFAEARETLAYQACQWAHQALTHSTHALPVRSVDVVEVLRPLKLDRDTLIATLLSDPALEADLNVDGLRSQFGESIEQLVEGIRKLNHFKELQTAAGAVGSDEEQTERLRQMLLAMTSDIRIMIVKLGFRVVRLRCLKQEPEPTQARVAQETQLIFAPLANRLGIAQLKWELEDLSFRYLMPQTYKNIAKQLDAKRVQREDYIRSMIEQLNALFAPTQIDCQISGRPKHIFSIWKKMSQKHLQIEELYDLRALRVYVNTVSECYEALGLIHSHWSYIKTEFDDYIANPKENGYQSIHTVVLGAGNKPVEIQIRTYEMHHHAEYGVAAHWRYKEGGRRLDPRLEQSISLVRQMLEYNDNPDLLNEISTELLSEQIYALTPDNEVITLTQGATPIDFAYHIHTELGHRCRGAKINGQIQPLTTQLQTGDKVEVLTVKQGGPNRNWLNPNLGYLGTSRARTKVRHWLNQQNKEANIEAGQQLFARESKRLHAGISAHTLAERFRLPTETAFYENLGKGRINERQLTDAIQRWLDSQAPSTAAGKETKEPHWQATTQAQVYVVGAPQLSTHLAPCCQPQKGDDVVGYVTRGRGVTVHRQDCANILNLTYQEQKRLIEVAWAALEAGPPQAIMRATVELLAYDRKGLLRDVMTLLTQWDINLIDSQTHTQTEDASVSMRFTIEWTPPLAYGRFLDQLEQVQNVVSTSIALASH